MLVSLGVQLPHHAVVVSTHICGVEPTLNHPRVRLHHKEVAMQGAPTLNHLKVGLHRKKVAVQIAPTLNHPRMGLHREVAVSTHICGVEPTC